MLLLAAPASAGGELSRYRAKTAIRDRIEYDYTVSRRDGMAWGCRRESPRWWRCNFAFQRENGVRWYCGFGSARLDGGKVVARYRLYRRCHGSVLPG